MRATLAVAIFLGAFGTAGCAGAPPGAARTERAADQWTGDVSTEPESRYRPVVGTAGMVVADDAVAAEWGAEVMRRGGNAIDAAVATGFAMAVTRPHYASLGGGGFLVFCPAPRPGGPRPECTVIDYREMAPAAAHRDLYVRDGKARTDLSQDGALASGVPGVPGGLLLALEKFGSWPRAKILERAIELAERGHRWSGHSEAAATERWKAFNDEAKRLFGCGSGVARAPCVAGARLRQPDLARVLRVLAGRGRDGFYRGWVARDIAEGLKAAGGIMTEADLAAYEPKIRKPVLATYGDWEIVTMPPPSAGGTLISQLFGYAELADRDGAFADGWGSSRAVHALAHAMTLAFADRAEHFGDPDFVAVPIAELTSRDYLARRWKETFRAGRANPPDSSGLAWRGGVTPEAGAGMETTHFSVVDREGNAVSVTTTVNDNFGSGFVPQGTGVVMNNEMDDFSIQAGIPNLFGLVGSAANSVAPRKRPLSSMSPTIIRDVQGRPRLVLGAQGGPRITTSVFLAALARLRFGFPITEAVQQPRFHQQWKPGELMLEPGFSSEARAALGGIGWPLKDITASGRMAVIERFPNGRSWGVSDLRTEGAAVAE